MAAREEALAFIVASMVEDVLQQHGHRGVDLASRRAEEAALRRYEAASWLIKMIGVVTARDLRAEPLEDEFLLCLRSGSILCNVLNKVQPGAVPKPNSRSLNALVHALLSDKRPEEVPQLIESVLSKVVEQFEHRVAAQGDTATSKLENGEGSSRRTRQTICQGKEENILTHCTVKYSIPTECSKS